MLLVLATPTHGGFSHVKLMAGEAADGLNPSCMTHLRPPHPLTHMDPSYRRAVVTGTTGRAVKNDL